MNTVTQQHTLRFFLRELEEPFEFACTPLYTDELKKEHLAWATEACGFEVGSRQHTHTVACDITQWTAFCFPLSMDLRRFKTVYYFFQMYVTMDDHADESWGDGSADAATVKKYWDKALALLEKIREEASYEIPESIPGIPFYMLGNFRYMKPILDELNFEQRNRYIDGLKKYMTNASFQNQLIGQTSHITMEQYKEYRVRSIGSMPCTLMIEYLCDTALTDEEYYHPTLQRLENIGTLQVAFINDLFSIFKEYGGSGSLEKLNHPLAFLVVNEKMTVQEGVDEICRMIEEFQNEFIRTRDAWYASGEPISDNVRLFVKGFEYYMSGNIRWTRLSKRYHGLRFSDYITTGTLEWSPEGTVYTPA